jgi:hypothetical protein
VIGLFAPELVTGLLLVLALGLVFMLERRWRRPIDAPVGRHYSRSTTWMLRYRRVPGARGERWSRWAPTSITVGRLALVGLNEHPDAYAVWFRDQVLCCRECLDDPVTRALVTSLRRDSETALVLFGDFAQAIAGRICAQHVQPPAVAS